MESQKPSDMPIVAYTEIGLRPFAFAASIGDLPGRGTTQIACCIMQVRQGKKTFGETLTYAHIKPRGS